MALSHRSSGDRSIHSKLSLNVSRRSVHCGPTPSMGNHPSCSCSRHWSNTYRPESVTLRQAVITPTQLYHLPHPPHQSPRSNQSFPQASDDSYSDDQVPMAHLSTAHSNMMNTDAMLKAKAITSTSHQVNLTDPSFVFAGPTV